MRFTHKNLGLLLISLMLFNNAYSWVYPEHRKISLYSILQMNSAYRLQLDELWTKAIMGNESRLTSSIVNQSHGLSPQQLDFPSWSGIAGDHSCSPQNLLSIVNNSNWILKVASITAHLEKDLNAANSNSKISAALHNSDMRLQRVDQEYSSRASANYAHFLLTRQKVDSDAATYFESCLKEGAPVNAIGLFTYYHFIALNKAFKARDPQLSKEEQSALLLSAFANEAFAEHFLQDVFAAGHIAGIWGSASVRKGTHDYYNEKGLEVAKWNGERMIVTGDGYLKEVEAQKLGEIIRISLEQMIDAAFGKLNMQEKNNHALSNKIEEDLSICTSTTIQLLNADISIVQPILIQTPVPGLSSGLGALPRTNAEIGLFIGISSSLNLHTINGGFGKDQTDKGVVGGLEANFRIGYGLEGVLNQSGDGLFFLQFGWTQNSASTNRFAEDGGGFANSTIGAAIPGRGAYNIRLRMPFYILPGDLILAAPLLLFAPKTYQKMAVNAGNGGLIPWQSAISTSVGRFQFMLGREVGVSLFGIGKTKDNLILPIQNTSNSLLLEYSSIKFDFPIIEYRPYRFYSAQQSSSFIFQLTGGFDNPIKSKIVLPENSTIPTPPLKTVWHIGLRMVFNWRNYL
ncbi:MAG: hypothetical protein EAZ12_05235 [Sphingobacteriia bacterium]|nr:MAG: hypothetical protein EAZ12_05235 [Sphingobacteriia bacterium]